MTSDVHALVGAYVLDALDDDERRRFEAHMARCETCRIEAGELAAVAAELAGSVPSPVSPDLRARVLDAVDSTRQEPPMPAVPTSSVRSSRPAVLAAAAVLVGVAVAGLVLWRGAEQRVDDERAARASAEAESDRLAALDPMFDHLLAVATAPDATRAPLASEIGSLDAIWSAERGQVVLAGSGVEPAPADHSYALWLIDDEGPHLAGLFRPDGQGRVFHAASLLSNASVGVTLETAPAPEAPTGPVLASVALS